MQLLVQGDADGHGHLMPNHWTSRPARDGTFRIGHRFVSRVSASMKSLSRRALGPMRLPCTR